MCQVPTFSLSEHEYNCFGCLLNDLRFNAYLEMSRCAIRKTQPKKAVQLQPTPQGSDTGEHPALKELQPVLLENQ